MGEPATAAACKDISATTPPSPISFPSLLLSLSKTLLGDVTTHLMGIEQEAETSSDEFARESQGLEQGQRLSTVVYFCVVNPQLCVKGLR